MPSITGTVFISNANAAPETDVVVRLYDFDLINKQLLGEVVLQAPFRNTSQTFQIRYTSRQYQSAKALGTADVQVQATTLDGLLAGETQIIFNAPDEVTDIRLELRPVENPPSEFERLVSSLTPLMEGVEPAGLTPQQSSFLARDSGDRRSHITAWRAAAILTRDTGILTEAGYGWFRRLGHPHTLVGLLEQDEDALRNTLVGAIGSNIIPDISDQINAILAQLNSLRTRAVFGSFTFDPPSRTEIMADLMIQAFDRDFRSEQLLGEIRIAGPFGLPGSSATGNYRIEYAEAQFQQNEGFFADLIVRAHTVDERYSAESEVHFNAGTVERIDLTLIATDTPGVDTPELSELEQLQADLEPIRENAPYHTFTDADLQFLVEELIRTSDRVERATLRQHLDFLPIAAQFAQAVNIPLAAFYGWFRQALPTDLAALLDTPTMRLQTALEMSTRENIIPDITTQIPEILEAIRTSRVSQGRLVRHRFAAQLINAQTNRPLGNISADVTDLDAEPEDQDSANVEADNQGIVLLNFVLPSGAPAEATRRLQLILRDEERTLATVEVNAVADQTAIAEVRVTVEPTAEEQTPIENFASAVLTARLRDRGIATVDDLLGNPDLDEDDPDGELTRLRDRAKIAVLNPDLTEEQQTYLLDQGLASPQAVARVGRAEFVTLHGAGLGGDAAAYAFFKANQDLVKVMHHQIAGNWLKIGTNPDDDVDDSDIPTGVKEIFEEQTNNCGCEDCTSAVSPAAYLAYLLDWTLSHLKYQGATVAFSNFENGFYQPFASLPVNCTAVTQEVRQVRLVVESLWRYIGRLNETDLQLQTPFRNAYRRLRNALYKAILTNLGVSYDQLRRATLTIAGEGLTADQVAAQRTAVANIFGVAEAVVPELFFNVDHPSIHPTEEMLEATFGYENTRKVNRFAPRSRPQLTTWQRETLEHQWQTLDWASNGYSGTERMPYIDPELIDESYLRTPLDTNPAFALLTQRQTQLADHRQEMVAATANDLAGLDALLESQLEQSIDQLREWFNALQGAASEDAAVSATEMIAALDLSLAGFSHLMTTRSTLADGASLGDTEEETLAAWNTVFDILSSAFRRQQFAAWVEQEDAAGIVFGPKLFWPSDSPKEITPWLATESEQSDWLGALEYRCQPPIIDPDQIPQAWVLVLRVVDDYQSSQEEQQAGNNFWLSSLPLTGDMTDEDEANDNAWVPMGIGRLAIEVPISAFGLWETRRAFVDARMLALEGINNSQANPLLALTSLLATSNTGLTPETLLELREQEAAGQDMTARLAQIALDRSAYRVLAEAHTLAEAGASIPVDIWEDLKAILVQVEKQREFAEWRNQEQSAEITLHPNRFQILTPPEPDKVADHVRSKWLHDTRAFRRWVATLEARQDQFNTLETALANAVSAAEAQILPQLRDLLISDSDVPGDSFPEKAEWLDKRLLMDMAMSGCQMTTRVSQAIETLQRLVRGVYSQEHVGSLLNDFALDAVEDYEAEWPVMGTYATWRAYMMAYLFPENLLHLSPALRQSYGFAHVKQKLSSRLEPEQACEIAAEYENYYRDICNLTAQATCQVETIVSNGETCNPSESRTKILVHIFALVKETGRVYTAHYHARSEEKDTLSTWKPISQLSDVTEIIGSVPHRTIEGSRYIILFVKVRGFSNFSLQFVKYNLDQALWSDTKELDLPPEANENFRAIAIQKRYGGVFQLGLQVEAEAGESSQMKDEFPTLLSIQSSNGKVYLRFLRQDAQDWSAGGWFPLFGPEIAFRTVQIEALIQRTENECIIFSRRTDRRNYYRLLYVAKSSQQDYIFTSGDDDGTWKRATISGYYAGGFVWPGRNSVYFFTAYSNDEGPTYLNSVGATSFMGSRELSTIGALNTWLKQTAGVSLEDYRLADFTTKFFAPKKNPGPHDPRRVDDEEIDTEQGEVTFSGYTGNLLSLLQLPSPNLNIAAESVFFTLKSYYLAQLQSAAIAKFLDDISNISEVSFLNQSLGKWKLADIYLRSFSWRGFSSSDSNASEEIGLANAVAEFAEQIGDQLLRSSEEYEGPTIPRVGLLPLRVRKRSDEEVVNFNSSAVTSYAWRFIPSGGNENGGTTPSKSVVVEMGNGAFRLDWRRLANNQLNAQTPIRLTIDGTGPFDLLPREQKDSLQLRRQEIRNMYSGLGTQPSVLLYLKEAYSLLPSVLGFQLQKSGFFEEALLWYRQIYDYLQSSGKRRIDHGLKLEQSLDLDYNNAEEWFDDASNPHTIAATRKNTYTRHILLLIIRCLIDYADALFARDNASDNARARELYTQALKLLDFKALRPKKSPCENILGELEVGIGGPGQLPLQQYQAVAAGISNPDRLIATVASLRSINWDTTINDLDTRLEAMRGAIGSGLSSVRAEVEFVTLTRSISAIVEQEKPLAYARLEAHYLATDTPRGQFRKANLQRKQTRLTALATVTDTSQANIPWLRVARPVEESDSELELAVLEPAGGSRLAVLDRIRRAAPLESLIAQQTSSFAINSGVSFSFCIPQNPVIAALRRRAENNLTKLRTCRNIAGFLRQTDPYGAPITIGSGRVSPDDSIFTGIVDAPPTPYLYVTLIARAKELVNIAQQIENGYQSALEAAEREGLSILQAEQNIELAGARVTLQDLRVNQANNQLGLANLQKDSAELREQTYVSWINAGKNEHELKQLQAYKTAGRWKQVANAAQGAAALAEVTQRAVGEKRLIVRAAQQGLVRRGIQAAAIATQGVAIAANTAANAVVINAETQANVAASEASFERRNDDWQLQQGLAAQDILIGDQQIQLAQDGIVITQQERAIAELEQTHAANILQFLLSKTFTEEMYRWIASVLEDVYRYFLQEAASIAGLAERRLVFEHQEDALKLIQSDYWNIPLGGPGQTDSTDRLGITGSARLLKDIYQLDQYAFETRQRKQSVSITLDLAELFPFEFQQFRETGTLVFATPQRLIDYQFAGNYLCLIQQVSVSVVALIPPTYGIRGFLMSAGISQTVVGGDTFQTVTLRQLPERLALTSPTTSSGQIVELQPDAQGLQLPFEGTGFATQWQLSLPKASNTFDYNTMATVLFTVDFTALHSFDYERQVIERLDRNVSANRAFRFRNEFADAWYDLNNPDQTDTPMVVRFSTRRDDFPPNVSELRIQHLILYFIRKDGETFEVPVRHLQFTEQDTVGAVGGSARSIDGIISTRRGNGTSWLPMLGKRPFGTWELAFSDELSDAINGIRVRDLFSQELIDDILLVITYAGITSEYS